MLSEIGNHFREGAVIAKLKLCRLELAGFLIATRIGTAAAEIRETPSSSVRCRIAGFSRVDMIMPVYGTARRNMATSLRKACSFKVYGGREAKSDPMAGSMRHADGMTADPKRSSRCAMWP